MDSIKDIIPRVIGPLSQKENASGDIVSDWQRLCGGTTKSSCIASFKDGQLIIHVDTAMRAMVLTAKKDDFLDDLRSKWPQLKEIRFKVGKITQ